jgi:uncharacterized protein (TIGR02246 family)
LETRWPLVRQTSPGLNPAVHASSFDTAPTGVDAENPRGENQMIGLNKAVSFLAGLVLLTGYVSAASAAEASKQEAAIRAINQAWVKAYNSGDAKTISGLYAEQAVLLPPGAPAANGNAAIKAYLAKDMAESAKAGVTFSISAKTDVGASGDLGWESGTYAVKGKSGATVEVGKYLTVYKNSGGKWLIIRDTWNSDAPPAPASPAPAATPAPASPAPAIPAKK